MRREALTIRSTAPQSGGGTEWSARSAECHTPVLRAPNTIVRGHPERPDAKSMSVIILACLLVACGGEVRGATTFMLSAQGYSPVTRTLLIHSYTELEDSNEGPRCLIAYDEVSGSVKRVASPGRLPPTDWAWVPGRAAFVGVDLEQVILFEKDSSGDGYTATPIPCPGADVLPLRCSWSPTGRSLAVNCKNMANRGRCELWIYRFGDKALWKTGVVLDHRAVIWENDDLLYGTRGNAVLAIRLTGERASIVRTTRVWGERIALYGMYSGEPLLGSSNVIRLGDHKGLAFLDQPSPTFRVIGTEKTIFVSASPTHLAAFGTRGNHIATSDPGRLITFGSVKDSNTVYGLADSSLVCVSVEKGALKVQTVADLGSLTGIGTDR